jgi:hypothetical protein
VGFVGDRVEPGGEGHGYGLSDVATKHEGVREGMDALPRRKRAGCDRVRGSRSGQLPLLYHRELGLKSAAVNAPTLGEHLGYRAAECEAPAS